MFVELNYYEFRLIEPQNLKAHSINSDYFQILFAFAFVLIEVFTFVNRNRRLKIVKNLRYLIVFGVLVLSSCGEKDLKWEKSPGLEVSVVKEYENKKPYLTVFYENFGNDTIEKIRYELISITKGVVDTTMKEIDPPELLRPKDRHTVPRQIGEDTVRADEVHVGQVWVVKKS